MRIGKIDDVSSGVRARGDKGDRSPKFLNLWGIVLPTLHAKLHVKITLRGR